MKGDTQVRLPPSKAIKTHIKNKNPVNCIAVVQYMTINRDVLYIPGLVDTWGIYPYFTYDDKQSHGCSSHKKPRSATVQKHNKIDLK